MQKIPSAKGRAEGVVTSLVAHGLVPAEREAEAVTVVSDALADRATEAAPLRRRLAELAGYVGGALVIAAGALFVSDQWVNLSVGQQVALLAGIGVLLYAAGVSVGVAGGGGLADLRAGAQPVRQRLSSVLFTGGAVAAAAAVIVWLVDIIQGRGTEATEGAWIGLGGSVTFLVLAAVGYLLAPTLLGQLATAAGAAYVIPFFYDVLGDVEPIALGLTFLALGAGWLVLAERALWREVVPARIVGSVLVVVGAQIPVGSDQPWVGYLATVLVAAAGFSLYVARRAWPYLAVGVVGVTLAVPEALLDWTEGSLGTAGVLLVAGVTLLVASLLGLRLRKEVAEAPRSATA